MTQNPQNSAYLGRCRQIIRTQGHMVQGVLADPPFNYSIGLSSILGCELAVFGLPVELGASFLNQVAARLKVGPIEDGTPIEGIASVPLRLVTRPWQPEPFEMGMVSAHGFEPNVLRILQWPDTNGAFPCDAGYTNSCKQTF